MIPENMQNLGLIGLLMCILVGLNVKRQRRFKIRPINRARNSKSNFQYYRKMKTWDQEQFFKFTRMTIPVFQKLLNKVTLRLSKQIRSDGISGEHRLVLTLQYLSQGTSMQVLAWNFQIGLTTVHKIIHETCLVLWDVLQPEYLNAPSSEHKWLEIAEGFESKWNFPHCLGALDGKHVTIQAPAHSGSLFYNYKKYFSIVLLAICDSKYRFTMVDIGAYGSQSDGGIFKESLFGQKFDEDQFNIPRPQLLIGTNIDLPYFLVADEAFPLKNYIMRPYGGRNLTRTQRIFNYRLSRARQIIENTFGILVARWRILKTSINSKPENVDNIIKAVCVLHNYCQTELGKDENNMYCPPGFVDSDDQPNGSWRENAPALASVGRMAANYARRVLYGLRDILADYFVSERGQVPWQNEIIYRGLHFQN